MAHEMHAWFVDVSAWAPATPQWARALALLPADEQQKVQKFVFAKDQRLALASRLLQRQLIGAVSHLPWAEILIARTPEGKPYWRRSPLEAQVPACWNYNVSHHGTIVAIAAHPRWLIGVDVMQLSERPRRREQGTPYDHFFRAFADHFTPLEWQYIRRHEDDDDEQFHAFYRLWSLKEAYIKAIGIGLGFQLLRAEFTSVDESEQEWTMRLDGEIASQWKFRSMRVQGASKGEPHFISVALGPPTEVWNPATSSIFPTDTTASSLGDNTEDPFPLDLQWRETTLDELLHE